MSDRRYVDFKKLKERVSMRDILDHYGLTDQMQEKSEDTLLGRCPITGSTSDTAFKVNLTKDVWYSFALEGDGAGGNILDFVVRMEETDIVGAANLIDEWFDETAERKEAPEQREDEPSESTRLDAYDAFVQLCEDEIAILESGARGEIKELLADTRPLDEEGRDEVADRLSRWILRAYQRGYKLGKMQGAIDERISELA
jgi:hypothetical protein